MALISCPECGYPIVNGSTTSEIDNDRSDGQTHKRLKIHNVLSYAFVWGSLGWLVWWVLVFPSEDFPSLALLFFFIGLFWYGITLLRTWWHHK